MSIKQFTQVKPSAQVGKSTITLYLGSGDKLQETGNVITFHTVINITRFSDKSMKFELENRNSEPELSDQCNVSLDELKLAFTEYVDNIFAARIQND